MFLKLFAIYQSGHKKGDGHNSENLTVYNMLVYALIYAPIYLCTFVKERKASLKFRH